MQDNAAVHCARHCKNWFKQNKVKLLPCPALSPGLKSIENVWGALAQAVYANGRQFNSVEELNTVMMQKWDDMNNSILDQVINSMPPSCLKVLKADGAKINY